MCATACSGGGMDGQRALALKGTGRREDSQL